MWGTRLLITGASREWALTAATAISGYATSVIACDAEAAIERELAADETPDGRPGCSVLLFAFSSAALEKAVINRVGQCLLTCPTAACYAGLSTAASEKQLALGQQLRFFGDGFQMSKIIGETRYWRIPVMEGECVIAAVIGAVKGVAGGNLLLCGTDPAATLAATEHAVSAMRKVPDIILPFPGGIVRSGSKVGSRYAALKASTNDAFCPLLKPRVTPAIPPDVNCVYEIVIDGLSAQSVQLAMRRGIWAATAKPGVTFVSAGNYGGRLGKHLFYLRDLLQDL